MATITRCRGTALNSTVNRVAFFFDEYVNFMRSDIARELAWVRTDRPRTRREWIERRVLRRKPRGAGNLLCALGLFVYTEAIGRVWR